MHWSIACLVSKPVERMGHSNYCHLGWICCDVLLRHDGHPVAFEGAEALALGENRSPLENQLVLDYLDALEVVELCNSPWHEVMEKTVFSYRLKD